MRTGRYRVRRDIFGGAVLQQEFSSPTYMYGHVDTILRQIKWEDVRFDDLANIAVQIIDTPHPKGSDKEKT